MIHDTTLLGGVEVLTGCLNEQTCTARGKTQNEGGCCGSVMKSVGIVSSAAAARKARISLYFLCLLAAIFFFILLNTKDFTFLFKTRPRSELPLEDPIPIPVPVASSSSITTAEKECDLFSGKWVRDEVNRPLYQESECPYIQPQLTCQQHGRPDKDYQHWKWLPHRCTLPSFNATLMLEKLRGKRMMFVGDSLNRGQYVSMICMLHRVLPDHAKSMKTYDSLTVFRAEDYNATIEFYWAPFLLESNSDNAVIHRVTDRIVRKGSINKHGRHWLGADILVFNTYLWWITGSKMKILQGSFNEEKKFMVEMETDDAYRMAMKSLVKWVKKNVDPGKARVFFTSMSPSHGKSMEWGGDAQGNCYNQTSPIEDPTYWGTSSSRGIMRVIKQVFSKSDVPITFLNITQLSEYRKDAHTSIYKKQWNPLTPEQKANPVSYSDCVHWCLPGLQDTWNELFYAKLFYPS